MLDTLIEQRKKERKVIIDFRVVPPMREWIDPKEAKRILEKGYMRGYLATYSGSSGLPDETLNDLISRMREGSVDKAVLQAEWAFGDYRKQNDAVYRIVQKHPDEFVAGFLCVNPAKDDDMVEVIEREVKERGFKGVNIQGWSCRLRPNDKKFHPVYAKCQELGIPVTIHSSINFTVDRAMDYSRPIYIDEVACDFPDLTIVANHGGWPWVTELIAVAWKHPNVYIEIGAVSPKYIGAPGTGWEPLMRYGGSFLQDKVLFATDGMLPHKRCVDELKALPLKDSVKEKWLGGNAVRLLGL
ncbi:MAG: amidohydrolase family protein [Dehalococcoidia bacterium]|nr:amidohydrolase family protein [Dehalococcoidia bacterium]